MNNEEMRIAIAEALGIQTEGWWCPKCEREVAPAFVTYDETHDARIEGCGSPVESMPIPNYTEDLNACREFEETLTHDEWRIYLGFVMGERVIPRLASMEEFYKAWMAKPGQRCEAFLRVKGLWKEESKP